MRRSIGGTVAFSLVLVGAAGARPAAAASQGASRESPTAEEIAPRATDLSRYS